MAPTPTGTGFVQAASRYIGTPYVWGGESPAGFDCSGLVEYVLTKIGLSGVPRTSEAQYAWADPVEATNVQAGDLVFMNFPGERSPGHVMIYAGGGKVIQAPAPGQAVQRVAFRPLAVGSSEWGGTIVGYGRPPGLAVSRSDTGRTRFSRPPRPGDPNRPGGAADPAGQASDAAAAVWGDYASELSPPQPAPGGAAGSGFASLGIFGFNIPGTGWVPDWVNPLNDIPGVPNLGSWNPLHIFSDAANAVSDIGTFLHLIAWLFTPRNILRVVEFVAGAGLILVGLAFARHDHDGSSGDSRPHRVRSVARTAFQATPIGREAAVARGTLKGRSAARGARAKSKQASHVKREKNAAKRAQAAARQPSETRDQHKRRRQREREQDKVPF